MLEVADVFRRYGDAYLQRFGQQMLPSHRRAFYDILHCRTATMGGHVYDCDRCGHQQYAYHSCKNRSCPKCQAEETEIWLKQRRQELLKTPYFHLVFTLPKELHDIVRRNQKTMYGVLMRAAARSLMKLAADPRYVGGRLGIMAVLHSCTRTLAYHPHVHLLVPAGGVTHDGCWVSARKDYLVPVKALSLVFRGVFVEMARRVLPQQKFPDVIWAKRWWIDCRPTVQGYPQRRHHPAVAVAIRVVGVAWVADRHGLDGHGLGRAHQQHQRRRSGRRSKQKLLRHGSSSWYECNCDASRKGPVPTDQRRPSPVCPARELQSGRVSTPRLQEGRRSCAT